jgi:hypothetical protein
VVDIRNEEIELDFLLLPSFLSFTFFPALNLEFVRSEDDVGEDIFFVDSTILILIQQSGVEWGVVGGWMKKYIDKKF